MMEKKQLKRVISKETEDLFIQTVVNFALDKRMTISNIREATSKAIDYMQDNAILEKDHPHIEGGLLDSSKTGIDIVRHHGQ